MIFRVDKPTRFYSRDKMFYVKSSNWVIIKCNYDTYYPWDLLIYDTNLNNDMSLKYSKFPQNLIDEGRISENYTKKQVEGLKRLLIKEELKK